MSGKKFYGYNNGGIDIYESLFSSSYPCECFDCGHTWMSYGEGECPECGETVLGVTACPKGCAVVVDER